MDRILKIMNTLADPSRRRIFERLSRGRIATSALAEELDISRVEATRHLRALARAGLAVRHQVGSKTVYAVDRGEMADFRRDLDEAIASSLGRSIMASVTLACG